MSCLDEQVRQQHGAIFLASQVPRISSINVLKVERDWGTGEGMVKSDKWRGVRKERVKSGRRSGRVDQHMSE